MQLPKFTTEEGRTLAGLIQDLTARVEVLERDNKAILENPTKEVKRGKP